jgi:hypothetical protein
VRSGAVDLIVIDSVAALVPKAEIEGEMGDSLPGLQARLMSQALRKLTASIKKTNCMVIFINQIRMKIGVMFGSPETTTGGNALKFYASVRLDIRRTGTIKKGEEAIGNETKVKVVKNKVAPPFKTAEFDILFGEGISREGEIIDMGVTARVLEKSGAWYAYNGEKIGQGRDNAREFLRENRELAREIENKVRESLEHPAAAGRRRVRRRIRPRRGMPQVQLSLKGRALRLLSGREHSRVELERKLAQARGGARATEAGARRTAGQGLHRRAAGGRVGAAPARRPAGRRPHPPGVAGQGPGRRPGGRGAAAPARHRAHPRQGRVAAQVRRAAARRGGTRQAGAVPGGAGLRRRGDPPRAGRIVRRRVTVTRRVPRPVTGPASASGSAPRRRWRPCPGCPGAPPAPPGVVHVAVDAQLHLVGVVQRHGSSLPSFRGRSTVTHSLPS